MQPTADQYEGRLVRHGYSVADVVVPQFNWTACGFCGALALPEGGPVGAAIACGVCGALA